MGALDFLTGGDTAVRRPPTNTESGLVGRSRGLLDSPELQSLSGLAAAHARSTGRNNVARRNEVLGTAAADMQQAVGSAGQPTSFGSAVDRALVRGKGLSRILRGTSDQYDVITDRARLGVAQYTRGRQGIGLSALSDMTRMREGIAIANFDRQQSNAAGRANMYGSLIGMGVGAIPDIRSAIQNNRNANSQIGGLGAGGTPSGANRDAA